jgi:hypothetical protein
MITAKYVIAIGHPETNTFLATYNSHFPVSIAQAANDHQISMPAQNGYIQILPAPWSSQANLMIISAADDSLLTRAVDSLPILGQRLTVKGSVAIVTPDQVKSLKTGVPLLEQVTQKTLSVILFGAFVSIGSIGLLIRHHHTRGQEVENAKNE